MFTYPTNNYVARSKANQLCRVFGIRMLPSAAVVQIAQECGYDALFIDLEHSALSQRDASELCTAGILAGVTPFVRVPRDCGEGMVQRVLDSGAMGVVFPHVDDREGAEAAVRMCKYPPLGHRSLFRQQPQYSWVARPAEEVMEQSNATGSTVVAMIETRDGLANVDGIAATEGVDVILVGSIDLSVEIGVPADFDCVEFRSAVETVAAACKRHGKHLGMAGIFDRPDIVQWALERLDLKFFLLRADSGVLVKGMRQTLEAVEKVERSLAGDRVCSRI